MVINSLNFLLFFTIVFIVYYLPVCRRNAKMQNAWLFLTSYLFYGIADWTMIPLLLCATGAFYGLGLWLKSEMTKQHTVSASRLTTLGVVLGVGLLLYFKYLNFFIDSFASLLNAIGLNVTWTTLNIVLPIGVSFFTFKLISYIIEIHREHIEPSRDFIEFATYIAFFPTILSGPIDRPGKFIPQLKTGRQFDYALAMDGFRQILWGMFTKMCIADCIVFPWLSIEEQTGSTLLTKALLYTVQMYADFDGYSNMAIGVGKLLGLKVTRNFNHPFLARNVAEYWRRWHISLTSWLTDYVFTPLSIAFRNIGKAGVILAVIINLVTVGFWHGANWTFGLFGLYHGLLFIPLILSGNFGKNKKLKPASNGLPKVKDLLKMASTFVLVSIGLIIFRADSVTDALLYMKNIIDSSILTMPNIPIRESTILFVIALFVLEWYQRDKEHPLQLNPNYVTNKKWLPYTLDYIVIAAILLFGSSRSNQFIYFQF